MKIIDCELKGNVVRFYLGEKTADWGWTNPNYKDYTGKTPEWLKPNDKYYGDDWDDAPYQHNAGLVYGEFIKGYKDIAFPFESLVLEPANSWRETHSYCKDDMIDRKVPCLIVVPQSTRKDSWDTDFEDWIGSDGILKYYFGDEMDPDVVVDSYKDY